MPRRAPVLDVWYKGHNIHNDFMEFVDIVFSKTPDQFYFRAVVIKDKDDFILAIRQKAFGGNATRIKNNDGIACLNNQVNYYITQKEFETLRDMSNASLSNFGDLLPYIHKCEYKAWHPESDLEEGLKGRVESVVAFDEAGNLLAFQKLIPPFDTMAQVEKFMMLYRHTSKKFKKKQKG